MMDRVPENRVFVEGKFQILGVSYFIIFFKMELVNFELWKNFQIWPKKLGENEEKALLNFCSTHFRADFSGILRPIASQDRIDRRKSTFGA